MENFSQIKTNFIKIEENNKRNENYNDIEEHTLTLRKKRNKERRNNILTYSKTTEIPFEIDLIEIEQKIKNEDIFIQFKNSKNENSSLGILFHMLLTDGNDDILKFSLVNIKAYLISLNAESFKEKNLSNEFNDKLIQFLFELLIKKSNDIYIVSYICFILNKLLILIRDENSSYFMILSKNFNSILGIAKNIQNGTQLKNVLYTLTCKIFLSSENVISKLDNEFPYFAKQIHKELNDLDKTNFVNNMSLISTLIQIISNFFFFNQYIQYFFVEMNAIDIFKLIKNLLNFSYQIEIFMQELRCIQNFFSCFSDIEKSFDKDLKEKVQSIIEDLELEKKMIPLIYDSSINEPELRILALQILINCIYICPKSFCETLIDNGIAEQILKLEKFLLGQKNKCVYQLLMDLIYNLIENESNYIIDNLSIENNCISLLFKLLKISTYTMKDNKDYLIKIFNVLIVSNHKYVQTLLVSEGICEWYKEILKDELNKDNVNIIIQNLISLIQNSSKLVKEEKRNLLLIHLVKIGMNEIINNLKFNLDDETNSKIEELNKYLSSQKS